MKTTVAMFAVAGIAAVAAAQSATINISIAEETVNSGDSFVVTVSATGTNGIASYDIVVSALEGAGLILATSNFQFLAQNTFGAGINALTATGARSSAAGNFFDGQPTNIGPNLFSFTVTTTADALGVISFGAAEGTQSAGFADFSGAGFPETITEYQNITVNVDRVNVVPTPSSLALLGLGGLAAARRRR